MDERIVRKYLDDLLVELEVTKGNEIVKKKFLDTINYYGKQYNLIIEEYKNKANEILEQINK